MKKILVIIAVLAAFATTAQAQKLTDVSVSKLNLVKNGENMNIEMDIDVSSLNVKNRRSVHLLPAFKNGDDYVELSSIGIYSRGRYIDYQRREEEVFEGETVYKEGTEPEIIKYKATVPYEAWMDGSSVYFIKRTCGCCQNLLSEEQASVGGFYIPVFEPRYKYIQPKPELSKQRELSGSAYIDFVVSRTDINPTYRNNEQELGKIIATIDSVKNDKDIKVRHLYLKGFASPESPYSNNTRLAKGRVASLKDYVNKLYSFDNEVIKTDYEPENWEGLREFVAASSLANKKEILEAIDSDLTPDKKEQEIKTQWPADYQFMLAVYYPALRKTDYKIEYTIVDYTDVNQILEIFRTAPNKLSLNELYIAANAHTPGSKEYLEVFETAVKMYPNDPIANLNAANVAIAEGNHAKAKQHLDKAGDTIETVYTTGIYYTAVGEYDKAEEYLNRAKEAGIAEAEEMLAQCAKLKAYHAVNK